MKVLLTLFAFLTFALSNGQTPPDLIRVTINTYKSEVVVKVRDNGTTKTVKYKRKTADQIVEMYLEKGYVIMYYGTEHIGGQDVFWFKK